MRKIYILQNWDYYRNGIVTFVAGYNNIRLLPCIWYLVSGIWLQYPANLYRAICILLSV